METLKTMNSKSDLEKENWNWRNQPDFRLYYKAVVLKGVEYLHKNIKINQWNRKPRDKVPTGAWVYL